MQKQVQPKFHEFWVQQSKMVAAYKMFDKNVDVAVLLDFFCTSQITNQACIVFVFALACIFLLSHS